MSNYKDKYIIRAEAIATKLGIIIPDETDINFWMLPILEELCKRAVDVERKD